MDVKSHLMSPVGDGLGVRIRLRNLGDLRRQLWGLVGFEEALGGRLQVGGSGRFGG
jgi:hypothetical protein